MNQDDKLAALLKLTECPLENIKHLRDQLLKEDVPLTDMVLRIPQAFIMGVRCEFTKDVSVTTLDMVSGLQKPQKKPPKPAREYGLVQRLKTWPMYFDKVLDGSKTFEIRKNDRDFQVGDVLILKEYDEENYTGRQIYLEVTYVSCLSAMWGLPTNDLVAMGFKKL